jgi:hypothetical protein
MDSFQAEMRTNREKIQVQMEAKIGDKIENIRSNWRRIIAIDNLFSSKSIRSSAKLLIHSNKRASYRQSFSLVLQT